MLTRFNTARAKLFGLVQAWGDKWLEAGLTRQEAVELLTEGLAEVAGDKPVITFGTNWSQ